MSEEKPKHISYTQMNMYRKCPRQWEYRYIKGLKRPPGGAMIVGGASHEGIEEDMREKRKTGRNLRSSQVVDAFLASFDRKVDTEGEIVWDEKEPEPVAKDRGAAALEYYHRQRAFELDPILIEQKFEMTFGEYTVRGVIDLGETDGSLVDFKTGSRKRPASIIHQDQQLILYQMAKPDTTEIRMEVMLRYKTKEDFQVLARKPATQTEIKIVKEDLIDTTNAMKRGRCFRTDPTNWWCSEKWCGYYDRCRKFKGKSKSK